MDKSTSFLEEKTKEFRFLSESADARDKPEIGHIYNDMANMLGVISEHSKILSGFAGLEKADVEAILDLFDLAQEINDSSIKKDEFDEKLAKLEKHKQSLLSKFPLKLDTLKLNFGIGSATFKHKDEK